MPTQSTRPNHPFLNTTADWKPKGKPRWKQLGGGALLLAGLGLWIVGMFFNAGVTLLATVAIGLWLYYSSPAGRTRR